jgi:large subunit ribosomal protein L25
MARVQASTRTEIGSRRARQLRRKGLIPGIIYGHEEAPQAITVGKHDMELAVLHGERILEIDVEGKVQNVLVKDVQWDTFGHEVLHVDLYRVALDERVEVTVPVALRGTPAGAADGGVLQQTVAEVEIECLVTAIPEELRAPVTELKVGDSLHLSDLPLPDGCKLLGDPETMVCTVRVLAAAAEAPEEEAEAPEPEVIGEKKEEDQQEASSA